MEKKPCGHVTLSIFFLLLALHDQIFTSAQNINVGLVLDMDDYLGQMGSTCISMALSDFYSSHGHYKTRLVLHSRDSKGDVVGAASAALDLLKNVEVQAIIGPLFSAQANFVIDLGDKAQVPIISFAATSPSLAIQGQYFIRSTLDDSSQVQAISAIIKAFGWREAVPIYEANEFGEGIIPSLMDALEQVSARVPYRSVIPELATDDQIVAELYKLMTMQTRVFIMHMLAPLGSRLFVKAKQLGMMSNDYVWIITDGMTNELDSVDHSVMESMLGVIGIKPYVPKTEELRNFTIRYTRRVQRENPAALHRKLNIFGLRAYDSAVALARAVEKAGRRNARFQKKKSRNSTELEAFRVSITGPKLLQALSNTEFRGLAGNFQLVDGRLQLPPYQIVNVVGPGIREVGYWTMKNGIIKEIDFTGRPKYSTSKSNFKSIIWPGDKTSTPRGWVIPTNGKKLRIGVPVKRSYPEFAQVIWNNDNNRAQVRGYSIDVFNEVMKVLPYGVQYEYVPFATPERKRAGSYDDLVYEVYVGNYSAVVGDVTIVVNRSRYVDFTLPYSESGVSMIVPTTHNRSGNAWAFLKPLTWDLWLTSLCSFVFIGFLIWLLEHRVNEDFRGPPLHQVGMIFWFAFSTMVFAHKEKVTSNLARFVLIIWFFVVLVLTQSYTASLTSILTVNQLQPAVTDVSQLITNGEYVGYKNGSFVYELLQEKGFLKSRLVPYDSREECDELFSKKPGQGGIVAAFDEIPYIKLFLAKYCSKYTAVGPIYRTGGFGFAFPKGSHLVPDVSRAILSVTEDETTMDNIERKWFGEENECSNSSSSFSTNSLGLESFWGLFLIAAVAAVSAFLIYVIMFLRENWHVIKQSDPESSNWINIEELLKKFDDKDLSSHTFRNSELRERNGCGYEASTHRHYPQSPSEFSVRTSPHTNCPPSPSFSHQTEQDFNFPADHVSFADNP